MFAGHHASEPGGPNWALQVVQSYNLALCSPQRGCRSALLCQEFESTCQQPCSVKKGMLARCVRSGRTMLASRSGTSTSLMAVSQTSWST